jgi:hypothetical protein
MPRITMDGNPKTFGTKLEINADIWDLKIGRDLGKSAEATRVNKKLDNIRGRIDKVQTKLNKIDRKEYTLYILYFYKNLVIPMENIIIESINDYLNVIENHSNYMSGNLKWYRAENELFIKTQLIPGLFREYILGPSTVQEFYIKESSTRGSFKIEAYPYMTNSMLLENNLTTNFIMQHYGAQTRLLDWSDNALIALFFAVENIKCKYDGIIWNLDPLILNASTTKYSKRIDNDELKIYTSLNPSEEIENYFNIDYLSVKSDNTKYPIAIKPHYLDTRMKNQGSCFTLHGHDRNGLLNHPFVDKFLSKIVIPHKHFRKIKRDLFQLGVSYDTVYPGLEGISKKVVYSYDEYFI